MNPRYRGLLSTLLAATTAVVLVVAMPQPGAAMPGSGGAATGDWSIGSFLADPQAQPAAPGVAPQRAPARSFLPGPGGDPVQPGNEPPQTKLTASDGAPNDVFGISVSIDGDTALIGSVLSNVDGNNNQGAAYVFVRDGDGWSEQAKLTASDGAAGDQFGFSVFLDGDTAVIGAPSADVDGAAGQGAAWVFARDGDTWTEQGKLVASDGAAGDQFGISATVGDDTAIVGAWFADVGTNPGQGAAWVFTRDGDGWSEQAKLTGAGGQPNDRFGYSAHVVGDTAAVGALEATVGGNSSQGAAYIFDRSGDAWEQTAMLAASDGADGSQFGIAVDLSASADTVLVGAPGTVVDGGPFRGAVYEFADHGSGWAEQARITAADAANFDQLGWSVRLDGDAAVLAAPGFNSLQGKAYVVVRDGDGWAEEAILLADGGEPFFEFGFSASLSGGEALVGASREMVDGNFDQGAAYVFELDLAVESPVIEVSPTALSQELVAGGEAEQALSVGNAGDADLAWAVAATGADCDAPGGVPWLSVSPDAGSTGPGATDEVTVTFDASGLELGDHEALLCVDSNDPVTPRVEVPVTLTVVEDADPDPVVCDETIIGVHEGPLTVSEGTTCLAAGAHVLGEVNVLGGAGLISTAAVVQGPISAVGATVVDLSFTQVTGPVLVSGATHTVSLFANQITGSVNLVGNSTNSAAVVSGNTIIGALSCFSNDPAPTHLGLPNTATAGKLGQCAEL